MEPQVLQERALDPTVRKVWVFSALVSLAVLLALGLLFEFVIRPRIDEIRIPPYLVLGVLALLGLPSLFLVNAQYRNWRYAVNADEVVARHGVVWRMVRAIPRYRIQHVDITSGPVDRMLGLAQLAIYTAGSAAPSISIPGLAQHDAERLRDELLAAGRPR